MPDAPRRARLLIVEDDDLACSVIVAHVGEDAEVVRASSAAEALAHLRALPVDVVIAGVDVGGSGAGLLLLAQIEREWPHIERHVMGDLGQDAPQGALVKPVLRTELLAIVASAAARLGLSLG